MGATFNIAMPDVEAMITNLAAAPATITKTADSMVDEITSGLQNLARLNAPKRTGKLRDSILTTPSVAGIGTMFTGLNYAIFVNGGTGLYGPKGTVIEPKSKQVLATKINPGWGTPNKQGYYIIGKWQRGMEANPFFTKTYDASGPIVNAALEIGGTKMVSALGI